MKVLILSKKFPYPLTEGEPIAINYLARSLKEIGCSIDLLVLNTSKHYFDPKDFPPTANFFDEIYSVSVDNRITLKGALKSLFLGTPYILNRFYSAEFANQLATILRQKAYDIVQFETIYMAHYLDIVRQSSNAALSLRAHNVEHSIWERVAVTTKNHLKKWYLRHQNAFLRQFELEKLNQIDLLLAITGEDLNAFRQLGFSKTGLAVPVGLDLAEYPVEKGAIGQMNSLAFIGALDWIPNQDGILWFLDHVWPRFHQKNPNAHFHVAGKNTPTWLSNLKLEGVIFHGQVPDAKAFINQHLILVAPLFSGSGIKIKVLEGMALERAVITTSIGVEGIPAINGQHLWIADTPDAFLARIDWCIRQPVEAQKMGKAARKLILTEFDNKVIAQAVKTVYEDVVNH